MEHHLKRRLNIITACIVGFALFSVYLFFLYQDLEKSFTEIQESTPTKIYSDVTRIAPPLPRRLILEKLKALAYPVKAEGEKIKFELHTAFYPSYLIPESHPQIGDTGEVTLEFESDKLEAPLRIIRLQETEIPDLYLEPELVATLAHAHHQKQIRDVVKFNDIPSSVWQAIIAVEDQHFLEHKGLDPRGLIRAVWVNIKTFSLAQGGSTITQQLVKNLLARRTKNLFKKFNELFLSLILEFKYDKEQILERYLNEVYLGQVGNLEVHGVSEGARLFYGKSLKNLNLAESALMAGLIRGPAVYSPYRHLDRALTRQKIVLQKMVETQQIDEEEMEEALKTPMRFAAPLIEANKAPYFVDYVKASLLDQLKGKLTEEEITNAGFNIYTTLDVRMNKLAQASVYAGVTQVEKNLQIPATERLEGALASVDQTNGYIRVLVGGRKYEESTFNRILNMKRQVGSTFKPVVYLSALQAGKDLKGVPYSPAYPMIDAPWTIEYDRGKQTWTPKNYEKEFMGHIPLRTALAHSVNTVAAQLGWQVGLQKIIDTAKSLGAESDMIAVPSITLGVTEMSPVELLNIYSAIANHGRREELTVIRGITYADGASYAHFVPNPKGFVDPASIDLLIEMLRETFQSGTARSAKAYGWNRPSAGKTGTTSAYRDSWFAGFTPQLTTVVWVGMDQDKSQLALKLTGATAALPIWVEFMKKAHDGQAEIAFPVSDLLSDVRVDIHTGQKALDGCPDTKTRIEKFIKGNEPTEATCL